MTNILISHQTDEPIYQQLFDQISSQILNGHLESDFNLPPIRTAAKELRISIITVKKAWEELERAGLIYSVVGKGCFISDLSEENRREKRNRIFDDRIIKDLQFYKNMGASRAEIVELVEKHY